MKDSDISITLDSLSTEPFSKEIDALACKICKVMIEDCEKQRKKELDNGQNPDVLLLANSTGKKILITTMLSTNALFDRVLEILQDYDESLAEAILKWQKDQNSKS